MSFADAWNALQTHLTAGTNIPNWTVAKGFLGDSFLVVSITVSHVVVEPPRAQNQQMVPVDDFRLVYNVWQRYCQGSVKRYQVRDVTRFSKYTISIFHWLEDQSGGQLP